MLISKTFPVHRSRLIGIRSFVISQQSFDDSVSFHPREEQHNDVSYSMSGGSRFGYGINAERKPVPTNEEMEFHPPATSSGITFELPRAKEPRSPNPGLALHPSVNQIFRKHIAFRQSSRTVSKAGEFGQNGAWCSGHA